MPIHFNKLDFENIKYSVVFVNQTSGTECRNVNLLNIQQIHDRGLTFLVPTNSCQLNHNLMVCLFRGRKPKIPKKLTLEGSNKEILFAAIGKVRTKVDHGHDSLSEIYLEFSQYDKKTWSRILNELKNRQKSVHNLFCKMRSYE